MASQLNYYDILGVLPGASADEVQRSYAAKVAVLAPSMIAGAPSKVIAITDRARAALELARRTLTDPVLRERHDVESGIVRPGGGLVQTFSQPSEGPWGWDPSWNSWSGGAMGSDGAVVDMLGVIADWLAPHPVRRRRVVVPDARGLFVSPARLLLTRSDLRIELIQLTKDPKPVEGLVVDQSPPSGSKARPEAAITIQVWHPSQQLQRRA